MSRSIAHRRGATVTRNPPSVLRMTGSVDAAFACTPVTFSTTAPRSCSSAPLASSACIDACIGGSHLKVLLRYELRVLQRWSISAAASRPRTRVPRRPSDRHIRSAASSVRICASRRCRGIGQSRSSDRGALTASSSKPPRSASSELVGLRVFEPVRTPQLRVRADTGSRRVRARRIQQRPRAGSITSIPAEHRAPYHDEVRQSVRQRHHGDARQVPVARVEQEVARQHDLFCIETEALCEFL